MAEEFHSSQPIYLQIMERVCQQIVRKELAPGAKLPSVREMALTFGVNPNTIQRTYQELERMEVALAKRGQGTFVTEDTAKLMNLKRDMQKQIIQSYVNNLRELGFSNVEMKQGLSQFLKEDHDD